ncbi:MAG: hypothetical protein JWM27_490 [Gemmatimonadetes bacterium]|nr:hypothetical protein [Gemmatimonadota bacterium]
MPSPRTPSVVTALAAVLALASAGAGRAAAQGSTPSSMPGLGVQGDAAAAIRARADSARYPYTAADVHFMSAMIGHHAQAIVMARWAPTHGASPSVETLAARIINAQQDEIATMRQWLRDRGQPVPEARPGPMTMVMDGMEHDMLMPGMLTEPQMARLDAARGSEFDRLFLTFMMQHHRGAVSMVKELFDTYGAAQDETVFKFASDVNVDQTTEIARMQRMLAALVFGTDEP